MPAGDAQRVWFAEMHDRLREIDFDWDDWTAASRFCREMTEFRSSLRRAKAITEPKTVCPKCGGRLSGFNGISIRSFLFAAHKLGLLTTMELNNLDKKWSKHRKVNNLDKFAQRASIQRTKTFDKTKCKHNH